MSAKRLHEAAEVVRSGGHLSMAARREIAAWLDQAGERLAKGHHGGSRHSHRLARIVIEENDE